MKTIALLLLLALSACANPGPIQTDQLPADTTLEAARTHAFGWTI